MELAEFYIEYGVQGLTIIFFFGMLIWFRGFVSTLVNNELEDIKDEIMQNREISIKLIDRLNRMEGESIKRNEVLVSEINDLSDMLNRIDALVGRLNGNR
jgi:hypothetical protein